MQQYKILIFTDHRPHNKHNSVYAIMRALSNHEASAAVDIVSRGNPANDHFFYNFENAPLQARNSVKKIEFEEGGTQFTEGTKTVRIEDYDIVLLRLPRPIPNGFFDFLTQIFPDKKILNRPSGIEETSSKEFLLQVAEYCPPIKLCKNIEDIKVFKEQFAVVLKPLRDYGGRGLVRIDGDWVWSEGKKMLFESWKKDYNASPIPYLGMKFLKNVFQGDKRIIVANGQIIGASLRLPPEGSWLCNISQGGRSERTLPSKREEAMVSAISPILLEKGIVLAGFDTLVGDDGKRVLSEINTLSIGGIASGETISGRPMAKVTANAIFDYIKNI